MRRYSIILLLLVFVINSCEDGSTDPKPVTAFVRMLNMVYDGGALDVRVNGKVVTSGTTFGMSSGYKPADAGRFDVSVHVSGDPTARNSSTQTLSENGYYTVYAFPPAAAFAAAFFSDAMQMDAGKCRIKLANCSNDATAEYELWITGSTTKLLGPIGRVKVTGHADLFAGTYTFSLRRKNDASFTFDFAPVTLASQGHYTFVIHGTSRDDDAYPFGVRMFIDGGNGDTYVDMTRAESLSDIAFVHSVTGGSAMSVAVDATVPQVNNLQYGASTGYLTFPAGDRTYTAAIGAAAMVKDRKFTLATGKKYSVFLSGTFTPQSVGALELEDETNADVAGALVRFIHLSPDAPRLNVVTNIPTEYPIPGMQGITYRQVSRSVSTGSAFLKLPAGTYTMNFKEPDSTAAMYSQDNVVFEVGKIYTMWLGGLKANNSLKVFVIRHN